MDDFKKYMVQHKEELDLDVPSTVVWQNIVDNKTQEKKTKIISLFIKFSVAACFILLVGLGWFYFVPNSKLVQPIASNSIKEKNTVFTTDTVEKVKENSVAIALPKTEKVSNQSNPLPQQKNTLVNTTYTNNRNSLDNAMLQNIETSFKQVIYLQKQRINTTPLIAESADYFKDFSKQIVQIEQEEKRIKAVIKKQSLDNDLLDELINIYQQKLNVLKQLQTEINKTNNRYKQNRAPIETVKTYFLNI